MADLTDFQLEVARLFFGLPAGKDFLLVGGAALLAQHLTARPTEDPDFLTAPDRGHVPAACNALEAAARERGWATERIHDSDTFCRLVIRSGSATWTPASPAHPSRFSWRPSWRAVPIRAFTVQIVLLRAPGRDGCGIRVHTTPASFATSTAATRSWTRSRSSSSITCGLLTAVSYAGADGITAGFPGVRSAGAWPGILTGVLKATVRDPQVKTPAEDPEG